MASMTPMTRQAMQTSVSAKQSSQHSVTNTPIQQHSGIYAETPNYYLNTLSSSSSEFSDDPTAIDPQSQYGHNQTVYSSSLTSAIINSSLPKPPKRSKPTFTTVKPHTFPSLSQFASQSLIPPSPAQLSIMKQYIQNPIFSGHNLQPLNNQSQPNHSSSSLVQLPPPPSHTGISLNKGSDNKQVKDSAIDDIASKASVVIASTSAMPTSVIPNAISAGVLRKKAFRQYDYAQDQGFICPITGQIMMNPVVASDGFHYEREAIEEWQRTKGKSPQTREFITNNFIPDVDLKNRIRIFLGIYPDHDYAPI
ncbi:MAG: hypothetical protein EZS28_015931 [Streblomastix strix]|uniref:U-box domain-containing protein n=1 Tax=Streblomastix strix TaxID=222440 RepID=A0A5J4W0S3_9EUKA|nr:MAG: hypothetical protein EZS28_015931 [Streblomastix strix]